MADEEGQEEEEGLPPEPKGSRLNQFIVLAVIVLLCQSALAYVLVTRFIIPQRRAAMGLDEGESTETVAKAVREIVAIKRWEGLKAEPRAAGHATAARPHAPMPILVAAKGIGRGWRLIHDSRFLNEFLHKWKFSLGRLTDFLKMIRARGSDIPFILFT